VPAADGPATPSRTGEGSRLSAQREPPRLRGFS
jgi:hypothetical protein